VSPVRVGLEILELARSIGARTIFVVGTARDVGKTTTLRAVYEAACSAGTRTGLASVGRDAPQQTRARAKPRLWLRPQTVFATARALLPSSPAVEILQLSSLQSAAGALLYARVEACGFYDLAGPPTASGVREVVDELLACSEIAIVDGAVDRVAALAGSEGAIVVATGAATATTEDEAVAEIAALVTRLRIPAFEPQAQAVHVDGALTAADAAAFIAHGETRQIVVRDPTQVAMSGRSAQEAFAKLTIRCRRPLRVVAATVASIGLERNFEPVRFANAVARATKLPTFDVYRSAQAA
jgi:hypothetical protein